MRRLKLKQVLLPMLGLLGAFGCSPKSAVVESRSVNDKSVERGEIVFNARDAGHCLLCHQLSVNPEPFQGNLGPSLDDIANRMSSAEIELRIKDSRQINPETIMPPYYSTHGLGQVGKAYEGQTVLSEQDISDLVNYLLAVTR